jgi:CheY-like chemotaxis protein
MAQILIANDDPDLLACCQSILEAEGHVVQVVADGEVALALVERWQPDVVVIDYVMPGTDGPSAIAALRADPATADVPILLMSGTNGTEATAGRIGADEFLRKPFEAAELVAAVDRLLRSTHRAARRHA